MAEILRFSAAELTQDDLFGLFSRLEAGITDLVYAPPALVDSIQFGRGRDHPDAHRMIDALIFELRKAQCRLATYRAGQEMIGAVIVQPTHEER